MDFFEVMEIQGLYDIFKDENDVTLRALSNGKISRPTNFKFERGSAETLNLVIEVKDGSIESLYWKNSCIDKVCDFEDCKETKFELAETTEKETNCYIQSCTSSRETSNCDTKVFVTWVGNDKNSRWCESDNYRITNFMRHSITTYFESAVNVAEVTRP